MPVYGITAYQEKFKCMPIFGIITYLLTPWSRVLLEKLTGSAASQEIPRIFGTRRFITVLTSARHQWRNQDFFFGGVQQIQLRTEDREDGDLGAVAP